jgi:outer membrane protein TolC
MARLEGRPMLGAGVNYIPFSPRTENGMPMGGNDMVMPMLRLTIPIYRKKYNALQKEAELKQLAVQQRRENTVNQLTTRWSTALRDLDDATRRTKLYREQTDLARQTLNLLMTSYATDGRDFEEVLRVQQQLLDYQLKLITSIVDQHVTIAMLENLAATELN